MDWSLLGQGFANVFSLQMILMIALGMLIGIIFGAIPGLSGNVGIILFLPFTGSMPLATAVVFLVCIFCGSEFGGSISAILIGTPGTNAATCTMLEGYPLASKGHAKKALLMALDASTVGGIISALSLMFLSPIIAKYTLKFGAPEYFAIAVFGLSIIASLSGKNLLKGLFSAGLGVIFSLVGIDAITGTGRFTFDNVHMYKGLTIMAIITGMFALNNVVDKVGDTYTKKVNLVELDKSDKLTAKELWKYKLCLFRSSLIGTAIGAIPGTGAGIASFLSYDMAKRSSKKPEEYGNGSLEGIAAAESSNNGVTAASLIPLLTLGLPGSPAAAVLIGAFTMRGLAVGPMLFRNEGVMVYTVMAGLLISNILMFLEGKFLSGVLAKITKVPNDVLVPILVVLCFAGVYSVNKQFFDLEVYIVAGLIGYVFKKLNVPIVPAVLGFVLGSTADVNLRKGLIMTQGNVVELLTRPITFVVLLVTVGTLLWTVIKNARADKKAVGAKA